MNLNLQMLPVNTLNVYKKNFNLRIIDDFNDLKENGLSVKTFGFYTSVSAVFSSKIEGEEIDLDSYIKHKRFGVKYKPDYTQKIDDLYDAYLFAKSNPLNAENVSIAHKLLTKNILQEYLQGRYRNSIMYVITNDGKIEYVAAPPDKVEEEMHKLYSDVATLLETNLAFDEVFFFASLIHLVFVKIHPFADGNGRTARLLEKWFLAQKSGNKAWFVQSERYYYDHHQAYYKNIRRLGIEYEELNYSEALPFLEMLPQSVFSPAEDSCQL
jgi:Fic family protein